ncbi:MAG: hypothetical protein ACRYFS_16365 [Janthinobacterium lividum]
MDTVILSITCPDPALLPEGDLSGILEALSEAGLQGVLAEEADVMKEWQRSNFASEGATFGQPWAPLSPRTIAEKERLGFTASSLIREGHLQADIGQTSEYYGTAVTTGIDTAEVPYGPYQQETVGNKPGRILIAVVAGEAQEMETRLQAYLDATLGPAAAAFQITVEMV